MAEEGAAVSELLEKKWGSFVPRLALELARLGDRRGLLPQALGLACELIDPARPAGFRSGVRNSLTYLAVNAAVGIGAVALLLFMVFPQIERVFADSGIALPSLTVGVITIFRYLFDYLGLFLLVGVMVLVGVFLAGYRLRSLTVLEKIPLAGKLFRYARWWRILYGCGTLMEHGVALDEALAVMARGLHFSAGAEAAERVGARLREGQSPSEAVAPERGLAGVFRWAVAVGQERGELARTLQRTGIMFRERETLFITRLVPALEVISLLIILAVMGLFVAAMYSPFFLLAGSAA
jgi:type II secretory pathway component PulF